MGKNTSFYIGVSPSDIQAVSGDLGLAVWYAALKGYRRALAPESGGYTRVAYSIVERDLMISRNRAWRYNQKLAVLGLIDMKNDKGYGFSYRLR